jgi:hypothetical protein
MENLKFLTYEKAKLIFSNLMEAKKATFDEKLKALEDMGDILGTNVKNITDFENNIISWVKVKDPELYAAYQQSLEMAA